MGTRRVSRAVLKGKKPFTELFTKGTRIRAGGYAAVFLEGMENTRIAVCVSKRQGNAVTRNRLKRITRENLEIYCDSLIQDVHVAILPERNVLKWKPQERQKRIQKLLMKAGLIRRHGSPGQ